MDLYANIIANVEDNMESYMEVVKYLYDHPEIGNEEFKAMELLVRRLDEYGFACESGYVVPTGFIGKYDSKKPGPIIAYLCEYDALPEVGHGCGHNLIAAIGLGAGVALKSIIDEIGGQVWVIGTPAEENFGGKVSMSEAGVFQDVDVAMMIHPAVVNGLGGATSALYPLKFEFFGKNAHGARPQEGKSALDAAVMSYLGINLLRQFAQEHTYIHGIIRNGGEAANVIPAYASLEYYFRGTTMSYVKELADKALKVVEGACLMSDVSFSSTIYECPYDDMNINDSLANLLKEKYEQLRLEDIEEVDRTPHGSSDIGSVSCVCPALHGYIKIADASVEGHSIEMANATLSEAGRKGLSDSCIALASIGMDLITKPSLLNQVKDEFQASMQGKK